MEPKTVPEVVEAVMAAVEPTAPAPAPAKAKKERKERAKKEPKAKKVVEEVEIKAPPMPSSGKEKKAKAKAERKEPDHIAEARRMIEEGKIDKKGLAKKIKDMITKKEETSRRDVVFEKDAEVRDKEVEELKKMIKVLTAAKGMLSKKKD
jgi:flagellar biosynthesis GTPase FlhF